MAKLDSYQCDRCGKKGDEGFTHIDSWGHRNIDFDLCRACTAEIIRWLKEGK